MLKSENIFLSASALVAALGTANAGSLPSGGHFVVGKGTLGKGNQSLTVKQSSTTGIIDWNNFSIGKHGSVTFDNSKGATLNRVTGGNISTIAGSLHATGSLYLMNTEGMIVSGSGHIVTGGNFFATADSLSNVAFANRAPRSHAMKADVVNRGSIISGGETRLIGNKVANFGSISATAVQMRAKAGEALDTGSVRATGSARRDAGILLISESGDTKITGTLIARNSDRSGGRIETSGRRISIGGRIDAGPGGAWLVDPKNLTVDSTAAATINASLNAGTNVTLQTTKHSASGPGTVSAGPGDIIIDSDLVWETKAALTLEAFHDIQINAQIGGHALLLNSGGAIEEANDGDLEVHTLSGSSRGSVGLFGSVIELDGFNTNGNDFYLGVNDKLHVMGAVDAGDASLEISVGGPGTDMIDLEAALNAQTVDLRSSGKIVSNASGIIAANTLIGFSEGSVKLTAANQIANLGTFDDPAQNANFQLYDGRSLLIIGDVSYIGGHVTLQAAGTIAEGTKTATQGGIGAHELNLSAVGGMYLPGVDAYDLVGLTNVGGGNVLFKDNPGNHITGVVDAGTGNLTIGGISTISNLISAGGTVRFVSNTVDEVVKEEGKGAIHATTLTVDVHGDSLVLDGDNVIANLGSVKTSDPDFGPGGLSLSDDASLTVTGVVRAGLELVTKGSGHDLTIANEIKADEVSLHSASSIIEEGSGKILGNGTLSLAALSGITLDGANAVATLGHITISGAGDFSFKDKNSMKFEGGAVDVNGDMTLTDMTSDESGGVTIDEAVTESGAVTITAAKASIQEGTSGSISAASLSATAQSVSLSGGNEIATLDSSSAGSEGEFSLKDDVALVVAGAISGSQVIISTNGAGSGISINAKIDASDVRLTSAAGISEDPVSGRIVATYFWGSSDSDVTLSGANNITNLDGFTTSDGNLSLTNDGDLAVIDEVNTGSGALTLTTQNSGTISIESTLSTQGTMNLTSAADITEDTTWGAIDAGVLNATAQTGISLTSSANNITTIGTDTTVSGPNNITQ